MVDECPFQYFQLKKERVEQEDSAFAQNGDLVHRLLDSWAKGYLKPEELAGEYKEMYPGLVTAKWPKMFGKDLGEAAHRRCTEYFENFQGFPGYKILNSEQKFTTTLADRKFMGIIDLVLQDEKTGDIVVVDHKSKSYKTFLPIRDKMYRQQLLYSKYLHEQYGKWPDKCAFNLFKSGDRGIEKGKWDEKPFTQEDYNEAVEWATKQIEKIENYDIMDWLMTKYDLMEDDEKKDSPDIFCQHICAARNACPMGMKQ